MRWKNPFGTSGHIDISGDVLLETAGGISTVANFVAANFVGRPPLIFPVDLTWNWAKVTTVTMKIGIAYSLEYRGITHSGRFVVTQEFDCSYENAGLSLSERDGEVTSPKRGSANIELDVTISAGRKSNVYSGRIWTKVFVTWSRLGNSSGPIIPSTSGTETLNFTAHYLVNGKPLLQRKLPSDLEITIPFSPINSPELSGDQIGRVEDWVDALRKESKTVYEAIADGRCPVLLYGYASKPGSKKYNRDLSLRRIVSVEEQLRRFFQVPKGKKMNVIRLPQGEERATEKGGIPAEQRVKIQVSEADASVFTPFSLTGE